MDDTRYQNKRNNCVHILELENVAASEIMPIIR